MGKSKSHSKAKGKGGFPKKKPHLSLTFDPKARVEYLSGFHKRKLERKAYHKAKLEKQVAEEKQRIKAQVKKSTSKVSSSHSILPEVEALLGLSEKNREPTLINSFVLGSKLVTVSSLDDIHVKPSDIDGSNPESDEDKNAGSENGDSEIPEGSTSTPPETKSLLKKTANRMLQHSKAYKASQRLKQKNKKFKGKGKHRGGGKKEDAPEPVTRQQPLKRKGQPRLKKKKSGVKR